MGIKWNKSKLDLEQLRKEIRTMSETSELFKLLRDELKLRNRWKYKARGNPKKANSMIKNRKF
jgi:hypothetical protein